MEVHNQGCEQGKFRGCTCRGFLTVGDGTIRRSASAQVLALCQHLLWHDGIAPAQGYTGTACTSCASCKASSQGCAVYKRFGAPSIICIAGRKPGDFSIKSERELRERFIDMMSIVALECRVLVLAVSVLQQSQTIWLRSRKTHGPGT